MSNLSPIITARLAEDVYALTKYETASDAIDFLTTRYGKIFEFAKDTRVTAKTGGPGVIKVRTAFGLVLLGRSDLKGHAVIVFRGTQYLADWLSNGNISTSRSVSGQPVHDGFNKAFQSMESQLRKFMGIVTSEKIHTIHCVGHSLGGALATLCGDWLFSEFKQKSYVYTFGSPRVGLQGFVSSCTRNLNADRIFRAYHRTDIVPCIPIWPYLHTPDSGQDYYLPSPGIVPFKEYHKMGNYVASVKLHNKGQKWSALTNLYDSEKSESEVMRWLKEESPLGLTISAVEWLNKAIMFVLEKCLGGAAFLIAQGVSSTFTLMDRLAYILAQGVDLAADVSSWVLYLMRKVLSVLGMRSLVEAADLSRQFIRALLVRLQQKINQFAQTALSGILADGRAV